MNDKKLVTILTDEKIGQIIARIAHEILEKHQTAGGFILVGIYTRGVYLAERLAQAIQKITNIEVPVGRLDITFYRDDIAGMPGHPVVKSTDIPFDINEKDIVIIDDVLFTGRTIRAALDALMDYGRPRRIMLAVLIDRGHRELPIRADIVGKNLPTMRGESVRVHLAEVDGNDEVLIEKTKENNE
jgi:pyrimidine operon attenuation protein / uracil phosphoribosyltransferase